MSSGVCPFTLTKNLLFHALLTGLLLIVAIFQGVILDVYIISADHTAIANYFWLIPDFLLVFGFVAAMASGYRNCKQENSKTHSVEVKTTSIARREVNLEDLFGKFAMPFYVWLVYSVLLVAKIAIIFKSEIPNNIDPGSLLSPQLLKVVIASSCLIFALLVEGQTMPDANSERDSYIKSLTHGTSVEILDSVQFLSLLIQSDSGLVLPWHLENAIIGFACINFLLPNIALVKLSRCNYGHSPVCLISSILYKMCHLWLVNVPYLIIRAHLWVGMNASVSAFIVKNIYQIFVVMKSVWGDVHKLWAVVKERRNRNRRVHGSTVTPVVEYNTGNGSLEWMAANNDNKFEEIDLKNENAHNKNEDIEK